MKRESWSIGWACLLGAFVGSLVALDLGRVFWPFGALLGGTVAYVAIDFRRFCSGVNRAYHATIAYRPDGLYWKAVGMISVGAGTVTFTGSVYLLICVLQFGVIGDAPAAFYEIGSVGAVVGSLLYGLIMGFAINQGGPKDKPRAHRKLLLRNRRLGYMLVTRWNPIVAPFAALWYTAKGLRWFIVHLPAGTLVAAKIVAGLTVLLVQFAVQTFYYVHTQRRTICFVDATLGAVVGYSFGSAIIGAVAGVLLGVVNYEVVSVRWLKIVSA